MDVSNNQFPLATLISSARLRGGGHGLNLHKTNLKSNNVLTHILKHIYTL